MTIPAASQALATAKAESVGRSSEHLARIDTLMQRHIRDGNLANALTLVMRNGKVIHYQGRVAPALWVARADTAPSAR